MIWQSLANHNSQNLPCAPCASVADLFSSVSCWKLLALSCALPHLKALPGTWESVVRMVLAVSATKVPLANFNTTGSQTGHLWKWRSKRWNIRSYSDYSLNFMIYVEKCRNNSISCSSCGHGSSVGLRLWSVIKSEGIAVCHNLLQKGE